MSLVPRLHGTQAPGWCLESGLILLAMCCVTPRLAAEPKAGGDQNQPVKRQPAFPASLQGELLQVNQKLARDILPEQNAVVPLLRVLGTNFLLPALKEPTLQMLGIDPVVETPDSKNSKRLIYPEQYFLHQEKLSAEDAETAAFELQQQLKEASLSPWDPADLPRVHAFLQANQRAIDELRTAAWLPHYYAPILTDDNPARLMSASWAIEKQLTFAARLLVVRALRAGEMADPQASSADLLAVHRWAWQLANGSPFDVSVAKAQVVDSFGCYATYGVLAAGIWPTKILQQHLRQLSELGRIPGAHHSADIGERSIVHQELEFLQTDPDSVAGFFELPADMPAPNRGEIALKEVDWTLSRATADGVIDQIVQALKLANRAEQEAAFAKLDAVQAEWEARDTAYSAGFPAELRKDRAAASRWIGESMAWSLAPRYRQRRHSDDRETSRRDLLDVALALSLVDSAEGSFPAELTQLSPKPLPTVPVDVFSGKPLFYERRGNRDAVLGSLGANLQNDDGSLYNDDIFIHFRRE